MATNWKAMQVPAPAVKKGEGKSKSGVDPRRMTDVKPRYLSMGSWHADGSKGGVCTPKKAAKLK